MQVTVGIDVNHPRLPVLGESKVHPPIVATAQRVEGGQRGIDHPRLHLAGKEAGHRGAVDALG